MLHAFATFALTGLIWTVQAVHYPLLARVGRDAFPAYHQQHVRRITWVVGPLMLAEAATGALLLAAHPGGRWLVAFVLLIGIWLSTALLQVPCHRRLERGYDAAAIGLLVRTNWIRTLLWTARSGIVAWALT